MTPKPMHVYPAGDQMIIGMDDGSVYTATPTGGTMWLVSGGKDDPEPPDPEPGEGGWQHPLGKQTPWTTYDSDCPGGSHCNGAVDFPLGSGTEAQLYAPCDGKVIYAGWEEGGGGNVIVIQPTGEATGVTMAHLNRIDVAVGQVVKGGAKIGLTGWTGSVVPSGPAGAHLHLEVRRNGTVWGSWFRTVPYFAEKGVTL